METALAESNIQLYKQWTAQQTRSRQELADIQSYEDFRYRVGEFERREWGKVVGTGFLTLAGVAALGQAIPAVAAWKIPVISKVAKFTISPIGGKITTGLWGASLGYRGYQQAEYFKEGDWYRGMHGLSMLGAEMLGVAGASKWLTATKGKPYTKLWKDTYVKYIREPRFTRDINAWMKSITAKKWTYLEKRGFLKIKGKPQRTLFGEPISQKRIRDLRQFVDPGYYGMDTRIRTSYDRTFVQRHLKDIYKVKAIDWRQQKVIDLSPKKMDNIMRQMLTAEPTRFTVIDKTKLKTPDWWKLLGKHIPGYSTYQTQLIKSDVTKYDRPFYLTKPKLPKVKTKTKDITNMFTSMVTKTAKKPDTTKVTDMISGTMDVRPVVISKPTTPTTPKDYGEIFGMIGGGAALAGALKLDIKKKDWTKEFSRDFGKTSTDTTQAQKQSSKLANILDQQAKQAAKQAPKLSQYIEQIPRQIPEQIPRQIPRQIPKITTIPKLDIPTKQIPEIVVIPKIPTPTPLPQPRPKPKPLPKPIPFHIPTFKFSKENPFKRKEKKKKAWSFSYSPSLEAGLKRITAKKIPKGLSGMFIRPVVRRKRKKKR